jgi:hypothetical protein
MSLITSTERRGMDMEVKGTTFNDGGDARKNLKGIKVVNEETPKLSDSFTKGSTASACGIYSRPTFHYDGCGYTGCGGGYSPDDHHLDPYKPPYDGCGAVHDYHGCGSSSSQGCGYTGCGGGCSHDDHHLDPPKPNYDACGGSTWQGWPIPSGC